VNPSPSQGIRAAVDIGGTFTDVVALAEDGHVQLAKVLTSLPDQSLGAVAGLRAAVVDLRRMTEVRHGTTTVINAILERKGARVGLITTRGFRDVIELGRGNRTRPYDLFYRHPLALVPRSLRMEVGERMSATGEVLVPVRAGDIVLAAESFELAQVDAVAVSLLNGYANPGHEMEVAEQLAVLMPGIYVSAGSDLSREWREYERTYTAILNAYVGPMSETYLSNFKTALETEGFLGDALIMQSSGGVFSLEDAAKMPIMLVESGPVAGIIGAAELAAAHSQSNAIAFDMGGTTAKAAVIKGGTPEVHSRYYVGGYEQGYPIQVPVVDVMEIGTGGGSIAWIDDLGALQVGPRSAGSSPGPACYGLGGLAPTVTDANLFMGRLDSGSFLGGEMKLFSDLAEQALEREIAKPLDLSTDHAASGIVELATLAMANALRKVTIERGHDVREFALVAYGGAGPLHAVSVASELGVRRVLIPSMPGHFSAWGMLRAPLRRDFSLTRMTIADDSAPAPGAASCRALSKMGETWSGATLPGVVHRYSAEARYRGQEHTLQVPFPSETFNPGAFRDSFHTAYLVRYGHNSPQEPVEIIQIRLTITVPPSAGERPPAAPAPARDRPSRPKLRSVFFPSDGWLPTDVVGRADLNPGEWRHGPCVIEETASTTVVEPGWRLQALEDGTLLIELVEPDES
jgi:N-methylhydantoinase A